MTENEKERETQGNRNLEQTVERRRKKERETARTVCVASVRTPETNLLHHCTHSMHLPIVGYDTYTQTEMLQVIGANGPGWSPV